MEIENGKKNNVELNNFLILYRHYKDYLLPFGIILVCILMVFLVVVPQFQQYLISQQELKMQMQKLDVLKANHNFLLNLDSIKSDADFNALSLTLPSGKDFAGIMGAVSYASAKTGVSVGDFQFSVGSLSNNNTEKASAYPSIRIDINLVGNTQSMIQFIQELYKTSPASEVTNIKTSGSAGSITVLFYYKPFSQQTVDDAAPIVTLSAKDEALIKTISSWNNSSNELQMPSISSLLSGVSSQAANLGNNPSPF
jgi:Tfp pilus assembly protein PilO